MKKIIKKVFSVFLSVFLLVTTVPMNAFAMSTECNCGNVYDDNGFCTNVECGAYEPAVETTGKYEIEIPKGDGSYSIYEYDSNGNLIKNHHYIFFP